LAKVGKEFIDEATDPELAINRAVKEISLDEQPMNFIESADVAERGATVAKDARKSYIKQTGRDPVSKLNAKNYLSPTTVERRTITAQAKIIEKQASRDRKSQKISKKSLTIFY